MATNSTREKKKPKPSGEGLFFEVNAIGAGVIWDEVSWYFPKGGCGGRGLLSAVVGETDFSVVGDIVVVFASFGVSVVVDFAAFVELGIGWDDDEGSSGLLFAEGLEFMLGSVGGVGFVGGVGVCI